jgi:protein-tyrosine phosphatase
MAQGVFEDLLRRENLAGEVEVDSAGTTSYHIGEPPDPRARRSAARRGLSLDDQRSRRVTPEDCERFDYVLGMDEENYRVVSGLCRGRAEVRLFMDFAPGSSETEIPDPYYAGGEGFEVALDMIEAAARGLLEDIRDRRLESRG